MIRAIVGSNGYELKRRLDKLVAEFTAEHSDLALERIDAADYELQTILEAVQAPPFLTERKLVMLRDLAQNKAASEGIEQIISSIPDSNDLIIYEPQIDKRTAYFKVLKGLKDFEEYGQTETEDLPNWLVDEAKKQGGQLSLNDARYLVERVGESQLNLSNELDKLITFDMAINRQSIDLLTEKTPQSRVFDLLDAVFSGNKNQALQLYADQRAQRVEPQAILAMLVWQLELITLASEAGERPASLIAKDAGVSPYPLNKAKTIASKLTRPKLLRLVEDIYQLDLLSKTKSIDIDEALASFIATA